MDGQGRCMDNIFIERLWRSLKYEAVYLWRAVGHEGEVLEVLRQNGGIAGLYSGFSKVR
jgi:transposase InsO family protein